MKILLLIVLAATAGCASNAVRLLDAAGRDNATVHIVIESPTWGRCSIIRINPGTNSGPFTIRPDGSMTFGTP